MEPPQQSSENRPRSQSQKQRALTQLAKRGILQEKPSEYHKSLATLSTKGLGGRKKTRRNKKKKITKKRSH